EWNAALARFTPDFVMQDHRRLGWETIHGPAAYVETLKSLYELAPDTRLRADHLVIVARAMLVVGALVGTRDGGPFEATRVVVYEFDPYRRARRLDLYDLDRLDDARARFEALAKEPTAPRIENAATGFLDRFSDAWNARDWERIAACFARGYR